MIIFIKKYRVQYYPNNCYIQLIEKKFDKNIKLFIIHNMTRITTFVQLYNKFFVYDCILINNSEEFNEIIKNNQISKYKFKIYTSCRDQDKNLHIRIMSLHDIYNRKTSTSKVLCGICSKKQAIEKQKNTIKSNNNIPMTSELEYNTYKYLNNLLYENFDIIKMTEGTKADLLIKPNTILHDSYIQIQLKTTLKPIKKYEYNFNLHCEYVDMIVVLVCFPLIWVIPGIIIKNKKIITITNKETSIYNKYKCESDKLSETMNMYYNSDIIKIDKNIALSSVSKNVSIEQKFKKLREIKITFLNYEYDQIEGLRYDFKINGYKIQEKYSNRTIDNLERICFSLHKYGGRKNKKTFNIPYDIGDNDFYWFHLKDELLFYIIPESILINHGYISTPDNLGKLSIILHPYKTYQDFRNKAIVSEFANEYLYNYDKLDVQKLNNLFKIK